MTTRLRLFGIIALVLGAHALMVAGKPREGSSLTLDGTWSFAVDSAGTFGPATLDHAVWRKIAVPGSWQAQCADLRDYQGVAWYKKLFDAPKSRRGETMVLSFGAVDYRADVFVNGTKAGSHDGGYTPFSFDIGALVHPGQNELLVRVMDPVQSGEGTEGVKYQSIPRGKQTWYVQTSGIWQGVRLDVVTPRRITGLQVSASISGAVSVGLRLSQPVDASATNRVELRVLNQGGKVVARKQLRVPARDSVANAELEVSDPLLWSPETPALYRIEALLESNPPVRDRFGFRSIATDAGKILLNGKPLFLIGALDQDFYPDNVYTTPSEAYVRDEMLKAKKIGLNTLRCHIKAPDPVYLKVADEVGLLVWYEIPNWGVFSVEAAQRGEQTLHAMVERDWNHPSLVILSIINESWGIDLRQRDQRIWLRDAFDRTKKFATGRLVVDNSACDGNFHMKTDLNDFHTYWAMPDRRREFDSVVTTLATRPMWLFSRNGDDAMTDIEPLLLSEFGTWGLPDVPTPEPWWMSRRFGGTDGVLPHGHVERFQQYGLQTVFGSHREMLGASQRAQSDALKHQIEMLRFTPDIQGYVITEFTDINWECNGVLDMWRNVKECGKTLQQIQHQDAIVARPVRYAWWTGESPTIEIHCSRYTMESAGAAVVQWRSSQKDSGNIPLAAVTAGNVSLVPPIVLPANRPQPNNKLHIDLRLVSATGKLLASSFLDLAVYPHDQLQESALGTSVKVVHALDSATIASVTHGGDVVLVMDRAAEFPSGFPLSPVLRDTGGYDGNWASALNWVRNGNPVFRGLVADKYIGFESSGMRMPFALKTAPENFEDVLSGMFIGWEQKHAAYVVQMKVGEGKMLVCAWPLHWTAQADPFSALLLKRLKEYVASSACTPRLQWNPAR
jgi:hypothetical protein